MKDPLERALEAATDGVEIDWVALETEIVDPDHRDTLHALRDLSAITRVHHGGTPSDRPMPFTWGPLHVRGHVGRGAHGEVYRAWDPRLEREVALKLLRYESQDGNESPSAIREGRLLARVHHPNVVAVHGADRIDGQAGIWMEFVHGTSLHDIVLRDGAMTADDAARIVIGICGGLAALHVAGLVHRDVKAQNVVRDPGGRIILMDLGAGHEDADHEPRFEGTPVYLAPELLAGGRASVATDIYAVGVVLFFLVTARYPITSDSMSDLRRQHDARKGARISDPEVPPPLSALLDRALSSKPADRFNTADEMRTALERIVQGRPSRLSTPASVIGGALLAVTLAALAIVANRPPPPGARDRGGTRLTEPTTRTVALPHYPVGVPSHDGQLVPYIDQAGNLATWEVETGSTRLVVQARALGGAARSPAMNATGDRIVYALRLVDGAHELRSVNRDGTWPGVIIPRQSAYVPVPLDWSRDGTSILCWFDQRDGTNDVVLVRSEGGERTLLHTFASPGKVEGRLSPDGRFAVATIREEPGAVGPLLIVASNGSDVHPLLEGGEYALPAWMPDGRHVFVLRKPLTAASDRPGFDAWTIPVRDGVSAGEPALLAPDMAVPLSLTITDTGGLQRVTSTTVSDVYTASIDLTGATPAGAPTRISARDMGVHVGPAWSPDGRSIAYFALRREDAGRGMSDRRVLTVQDLVSGARRVVPARLSFTGGYSPAWAPDSRSVAIWGRDGPAAERFGYFRVDIVSGETVPLVTVGTQSVARSQYSADGRTFFYLHPVTGIMARNLGTGGETVVVPATSRAEPASFAVAPDGRSIAFVASQHGDAPATLNVQRTGEPPVRLAIGRGTPPSNVHGWTPDGRSVLFSRAAGRDTESLWLVPAQGGAPIDLRFTFKTTPNLVRLSPDGTRIAYPERVLHMELRMTRLPDRRR